MTPETSPSTRSVAPALRSLLAGIIDYAGLFPPAGLPLDEALAAYARHLREREAWMLARFVLPAARLGALPEHAGMIADVVDQGAPFRLSVLGTGGEDTRAFEKSLAADLREIDGLRARLSVAVEVMEVRLPPALLSEPRAARLRPLLDAAAARIVDSGLPRLGVFFEIPLVPAPPPVLPALAAALADFQDATRTFAGGLKMRTGGLEATAFPSADAVAAVIATCRDHRVRFKATAGLHHPVRRFHGSVQTHMHGFLNVFGAAVLAHAHGLHAEALRAILLDEDPSGFRLDDDHFAWRDLSASAEDVRRARTDLAVSFGSCSFDEPREDLVAMGWL